MLIVIIGVAYLIFAGVIGIAALQNRQRKFIYGAAIWSFIVVSSGVLKDLINYIDTLNLQYAGQVDPSTADAMATDLFIKLFVLLVIGVTYTLLYVHFINKLDP